MTSPSSDNYTSYTLREGDVDLWDQGVFCILDLFVWLHWQDWLVDVFMDMVGRFVIEDESSGKAYGVTW